MKKDIYGVIYKITNNIDRKSYIGQTSQKGGFDRRYKHNIEKYTNNPHLKRAIHLYGIENFIIEKKLDIAYSKEELDTLEEKYIKEFNTINPRYGYNLKSGGSNGKLSEETKLKLKIANLGKTYSEEVNKKKALHGEKNGMFGKHHDKIAKTLISEKRKGKYKGKDNPVSQPIRCITTSKVFDSIVEAGEYYDLKSSTHISSCCYGLQKHCGKLPDGTPLSWEFLNPNVQKQFRENEGRKKSFDKNKKIIICLNDGNMFKGHREVGDYYNIKSPHHISDVCLGKNEYCGLHPITLEPLKFIYFDNLSDYLHNYLNSYFKHIKEIILLMLRLKHNSEITKSKNGKKTIICLNDCNVFEGQKEVGKYYKIKSPQHISSVCLGKSKYCSYHPITLEPLKFIYFDDLYDYFKKLLNDINIINNKLIIHLNLLLK